MAASGPIHLALFFYSLNWSKIVQTSHHIYLFTTFLLLGEQLLVHEQPSLTDFVKFYLNYQPALILLYKGTAKKILEKFEFILAKINHHELDGYSCLSLKIVWKFEMDARNSN